MMLVGKRGRINDDPREKSIYKGEKQTKKGGGRTIAMKRKGSVDNVRYEKKGIENGEWGERKQ